MTRIISIASGKGGVGKTTVTANLGAALNEFGYRTLVMDTNLTTPNLGFHLGVPLYPKTLHDVLKGDAYVDEAIYVHPTGLKIIPAGISMADLKSTNPKQLGKVVLDLVGDHDVVLLDGAAGLGNESIANIQAADEVLIVTNPQLPSVTDALKTVKVAEESGTHILGVVLNRIRGNKSELSADDVESLLGYPIIATVPDHDIVQESLAAKTPVVHYSPNAKSSIELKKLSASLMGMDWEAPAEDVEKQSILSRFFGFLRK